MYVKEVIIVSLYTTTFPATRPEQYIYRSEKTVLSQSTQYGRGLI